MSGMIVDYLDYQKIQAVSNEGPAATALTSAILAPSLAILLFARAAIDSLSLTSASFLMTTSPLKPSRGTLSSLKGPRSAHARPIPEEVQAGSDGCRARSTSYVAWRQLYIVRSSREANVARRANSPVPEQGLCRTYNRRRRGAHTASGANDVNYTLRHTQRVTPYMIKERRERDGMKGRTPSRPKEMRKRWERGEKRGRGMKPTAPSVKNAGPSTTSSVPRAWHVVRQFAHPRKRLHPRSSRAAPAAARDSRRRGDEAEYKGERRMVKHEIK
ncbi:hypothetical protein C8J57DRAFT_1475418 [Mycena rebaudengoi]|nr:hypothetical protein C8J57DRAFT_1475418 [Mycena rebaudengoi]